MEFTQSGKQITTIGPERLILCPSFTFVWGHVQALHFLPGSEDIDYLVVEYITNPSFILSEGKTGGGGKLSFHPYIIQSDGVINDTNHSYDSIEAAIVDAIALRFAGLNTQAGSFFMKVIGTETQKEWLPMSERYPHLTSDLDKEPSHFLIGDNGKDWACESLNSSGGG